MFIQQVQDDRAEFSSDSVGEYTEIAYLLEMLVRDMADDTSDELMCG